MAGPADIRAQAKVVVEGLNSLIGTTLDAGPQFHEIDYRELEDKQPPANFTRAFAIKVTGTGADETRALATQIEHDATLEVALGYLRRKSDGAVLDTAMKDATVLLDRMERPTNYAASTTGLVRVSAPRAADPEDVDPQRRLVRCTWRVQYRVTRV